MTVYQNYIAYRFAWQENLWLYLTKHKFFNEKILYISTMRSLIKPISVISISFLIAACGGGGGGGGSSSVNSTPTQPVASTATVTTLAGGGSQAVNATGASATFYHPMGVAVDSAGTVYVADAGNNQIRKIAPNGSTTLLAGSRTRGDADGAGAAASFRSPFGVAVDSSGNVYVADTGNGLIRKISSSGVVTTLAGRGTASLTQVEGIAVDGAGNVYASSPTSNTILKITPAGAVSTMAGDYTAHDLTDGTGTAAHFSNPKGVAVDTAGNVYVADTNNSAIRKITPAGVVTTVLANLLSVSNIAVDAAGNLYVTDHMYGVVTKIDSSLNASTLVSNGGLRHLPAFNSAWQTTNNPYGIAVDSNGNLYVSDTWNNQIQVVDTSSGNVSLLAGSPSYGTTNSSGVATKFNRPNGIVADSNGNIFVADTINCSIRKISASGVTTTFAGSTTCALTDGTGTLAAFVGPWGMSIDARDNIYVTDSNSIRKITPTGVVTTLAGSASAGSADGTGGSATFRNPEGLVVDSQGDLYVADTGNHMIRKVTSSGVVTTFAGSTSYGNLDGTGTSAKFNAPSGIVIDSNRNIFVSDYTESRLRKITSAGVVTTFAGGASSTSTLIDATGVAAKFASPAGLAIDSSDNIFVADSYNNSIRKVTPSAVVTTIAGSPTDYATGGSPGGNLGNLDGAANQASFFNPEGVAVGPNGVIYVSDTWNDQIRKITP